MDYGFSEALQAFMPLVVEATAPAMASSSTATSALVVVIGHRRIEVGAGFDTGAIASIVTAQEALP